MENVYFLSLSFYKIKPLFSVFLNTELKGKDTHVRVSSTIDARADEGDELVASLVDHEPADLALVALLAETPRILYVVIGSKFGSKLQTGQGTPNLPRKDLRLERREVGLSSILGWKNKSINKFLS